MPKKSKVTAPKKGIKPKNRRSSANYPALEKKYTLKSRVDLLDYDYVDKLKAQAQSLDPVKAAEAEEALQFLNDFTEGDLHADFRDKKVKKLYSGHDDLRKSAYRRNNYRFFDLFNKRAVDRIDWEEYENLLLDAENRGDLFDDSLDLLDNEINDINDEKDTK